MMYPQSDLIKNPTDGKTYIYSELFKGNKVVVTAKELQNYDMHPQSGAIKKTDGTVVNLIDLIYTMATKTGGGTGGTAWDGTLTDEITGVQYTVAIRDGRLVIKE